MNNYLVFDLETTTKEVYGRVANPFFNSIVAVGLAREGIAYSEYVYPNKLEKFIIQEDILIGHNIKFDLLYVWHLDDIQNFFKCGGRIWDTQYAEYLLSGQQHKFPALRDIAVNKYGCKEREKKMEQYWDRGIDTSHIPKELVLEDVQNDVLDTEKIYLQQVEKAKQVGMYNLIDSLMDGLLATTEMEYNGMYVNKDILLKNKEDLEITLKKERENLAKLVSRYWL